MDTHDSTVTPVEDLAKSITTASSPDKGEFYYIVQVWFALCLWNASILSNEIYIMQTNVERASIDAVFNTIQRSCEDMGCGVERYS